jgi:site-specific DNA-methyltransferase (adenine-specific)
MRVEKLGGIDLRCQDCMEYMRGLEDGAFDLAIVDPPYGLPKQSTHGRGKLKNRILNAGHIQDWDVAPNQEYFDELFRVSKHQIIWGGNYFDLPPTRGVICWDKCQPFENFSQWEMAWTSFATPASLFRFDNRTGDKIHPTQKPVDLYRWLLHKYAKGGWKILDTHIGSGSSAIACYMEGHELVGCEINEEYFNKMVVRVKNSMAQGSLF